MFPFSMTIRKIPSFPSRFMDAFARLFVKMLIFHTICLLLALLSQNPWTASEIYTAWTTSATQCLRFAFHKTAYWIFTIQNLFQFIPFANGKEAPETINDMLQMQTYITISASLVMQITYIPIFFSFFFSLPIFHLNHSKGMGFLLSSHKRQYILYIYLQRRIGNKRSYLLFSKTFGRWLLACFHVRCDVTDSVG